MLVEKWESGHNFPKFTAGQPEPQGPRRFTTTVRYLRAHRGQFTYEDHQSPWSIVCPNHRPHASANLPNYHGEATFNGGTVQIQNYVPMWANMKARFVHRRPARASCDRIDLDTDGAQTVARGERRARQRWPEQTYDFESRVQFPADARASSSPTRTGI